MKLEITGVKDAGNLDSERVVLRALEDVDIGSYISFFSEEMDEGKIAADMIAPLWLANKKIGKGDYVVVYTRAGREGSKIRSDGKRTYFYYRGLTKAVCEHKDVVAVLLEAREWGTSS